MPSSATCAAVLRPAALFVGLLVAGLALHGFANGLDAVLIDRLVIGQGPRGQAIFVLLAALACASFVPRQATGFAAGYAFSPGLGIALAIAAQALGCVLDFLWARLVAQDWARRTLRGRLARWEAMLAAHPFAITLIARLLPVGNNTLFSLIGGASSARPLPFLAASAIGYLPQTLVFVYLGAGARVAGWQQIALSVALFAVSAALGIWLYRRHQRLGLNAGS